MYLRVVCLFLLLISLAGCSNRVSTPPITSDHPANPDAAEAPISPPSETLITTNESTPNTPMPSTQPAMAGTLYSCPMHPDVISAKPGTCPKCGMKLVAKKQEAR